MSNRCYLVGAERAVIYPATAIEGFNPQTDTYLASAGCIPLAWLIAFRPADLQTQTLALEDGPHAFTAPLVDKQRALEQFDAIAPWVDVLFASSGGLAYHFELFRSHLASASHAFLTIELEEIEALHAGTEVQQQLRWCFDALERRDAETARAALVWLSTVMPERRFVTLEDADAGRATREDQWNFFRILGEGWGRAAPWE